MILLFALLAGVFSAFSFAPVGLWPLMPLSIALLCAFVARQGRLRGAMAVGWAYGVGQFALGLNWIATAFTFQAAMPAWLGWVAVVLLSLYLAVYPMLAVALGWTFGRRNKLALVLALAGGWGVTEWLRARIFTGFSWNPLGVTLVDTPWRAASAYVGTYGLSMLVVLAGGLGWLAWQRQWKPGAVFAALAGLMLALPKPMVGPMDGLTNFDLEEPSAPVPAAPPPAPPRPGDPAPPHPSAAPPPTPLIGVAPRPAPVTAHSAFATGRVRVVQPNIGQGDKWREGFAAIAARRLAMLSMAPDAKARDAGPAETVFWPEAAVTEPLLDERQGAAPFVADERFRAVSAIRPGQLLATGGLGLTSSDGVTVDGATNSVFVLDAGGRIVGRYDKAHLVPYGEYLPMRPILSAIGLSRLAPGDMDFRAGPGPQTLHLPNGRKMGVQICYEIIFSGEVIDPADRPDYLFNPSNDAWFGAWGPPQHLAQARLRAAEEAMGVIRATPTGVSAVIDALGVAHATGAFGKAAVLDTPMPDKAPPTLFARGGNMIPLGIGFLLIIAAIALARRGRYSDI